MNSIDAKLEKAAQLLRNGNGEQAQSITSALADDDLTTDWQHSTLAMLLQRMGAHERALLHFKRAVTLNPGSATHQYNLATEYRFLGDQDNAGIHLDEAIKSDADDVGSWLLRSQLRRQSLAKNNISGLRELWRRLKNKPQSQVMAGFALAKELEDVGEYGESFEVLKSAAELRRSLIQYTPQNDLRTIDQIQTVFDQEFFSSDRDGCDSTEPVFILGMPRTGTTLVERILASHANVFAAGELNNFAISIKGQVRQRLGNQAVLRDELVSISAKLDCKRLGQAYVDSTRPTTGHTLHFIDKLPFNYLYLGLIHRALPRAKIVHVRRNPMDTCYAVYKTLFESGYPFSYDLQELGRYFVAHHKLMLHWEQMIPGRIHHISYEDLVKEPEHESRKLIEYCQLQWDDNCLAHHSNPDAATTASASQVRLPVYQSSVGLWRNYAEQLRPLQNLLRSKDFAT